MWVDWGEISAEQVFSKTSTKTKVHFKNDKAAHECCHFK
jgi:hypothetical protein